MTNVALGFYAPMPSGRSRWVTGILGAVLLHLVILGGFLVRAGMPVAKPPAAPPMALDMSALPSALSHPNNVAIAKAHPVAPASKPVVVKPDLLPLPPSPAPAPAVLMPIKPPKKPQPRRPQRHSAPPVMAAAPSADVLKQKKLAAAPVHGVSSQPPNNALMTWQSQILSQIEQVKRYPTEARWRDEQGLVVIQLNIARSGALEAAKLVSGSGFSDLDQAAIAAAYQAAPFPPPPASLPGPVVVEPVAVDFSISGP